MNVTDIISDLEGVGVQLWADSEQIRFRAPRGVMNEERRTLLQSHKQAVMEHLRSHGAAATLTPDPENRYAPFPMTGVQSAYLLGRSAAFDYGGVSSHIYLEVAYPDLEPAELERALHVLIRRHDALRTVFHVDGYQRVLPEVPPYRIEVDDLRGGDASSVSASLERMRAELGHRMAPTDSWPLFTLRVTRADDCAWLHLSIDLLIADAASIQQLLAELRQLYLDPACSLPPVDITFRDYVLAERRLRDTPRYHRDRTYWWDRIDELPAAPQLPVLEARPVDHTASPEAASSARFRRLQATLSPSEWTDLRRLAGAHEVTVTGAVLTAYAEVIGTWSGQRRFTLNLPVFQRAPLHEQVERLIGDFTSIDLLAVDLDEQTTFARRAKALSGRLFDDLDHSSCSGVEVLGEIARRRGRAAATMPVVFTSIVGAHAAGVDKGGETVFSLTQTPQVWIDCQLLEHRHRLQISWDIREGVFPEGLVEDAFAAFESLVRRLGAGDTVWNTSSPVTLPEHQHSRRARINETAGPLPAALLHEGVVNRALETPNALAVLSDRESLTYGELLARATAVADALRAMGCIPDDIVAVFMEKGPEQVIAVLGTLLADAVFLPIDVTQPRARRDQILNDAGVRYVLTQSRLPHEAESAGVPSAAHLQWMDVDQLTKEVAVGRLPARAFARAANPDKLAYVIYTSGSTGAPKGVMISHQSALNTIVDINRRFEVTADDRVLHLVHLGFDLSVYDIFGLLTAGGALVLPDPERRSDPSHWADLATRFGVTIWNSVPAQFQILRDYLASEPRRTPAALRLALLSGDWIPVALPDQGHRLLPDLRIVSLGGATEAAIWSIVYPIEACEAHWRSIPYGKPLTNQRFYVLDSGMRDCPEWVSGELYIGGAGLARGYLGDKGKTEERFVRHPDTGERLYRTGDFGRYMPDGNIEFLGRQDLQVKIRGHRIELAEIEAALASHPAVAGAAVLVDGGRSIERRLVAFCEHRARSEEPEPRECTVPAAMDGACTAVAATFDGEMLVALMNRLDEVAICEMIQHLRHCGLFAAPDATYGEDEVANVLRASPVHRRLLRRWLDGLVAAEKLVRNPDDGRYHGLSTIEPARVAHAWEALERLDRQLGYGTQLLDYMRACIERLGELLRGDLDMRTLLFPDRQVGAAQVDTAWGVYRDNLVSRSLNQILIAGVRRIVTERGADSRGGKANGRNATAPVRVLEVGAGVGGTSTSLIPALATYHVDYLFTDVSPFFLAEAKERFAEHPWVRYGLFDINVDARQQGVLPNSVDIVVCVHVLHNASDITQVLRRLHEVLTPGGWLVFVEPTHRHNYPLLVSMEFLAEMTAIVDQRQGTSQRFFTREQWLELLESVRIGHPHCSPAPADALSRAGQHVFFTQVKTDREAATAEQIMAHLAERLPEYMVPSQLQWVDALPRSPNAKLDRAALRTWLPSAARQQNASESCSPDGPIKGEEPLDDLERRIARLWADMLGHAQVGRHDDFYALGGDSLLISRLVGRLREQELEAAGLEWEVLLRQMLREPTVAALAAYLRGVASTDRAHRLHSGQEGGASAARSPLVLLHGEGAEPAVVLVHPATGTLLSYQALLAELRKRTGAAGPIFGLEVADQERYLSFDPGVLIERLASDYAQLLLSGGRTRFHMVGYCLGGLIATETAKALKEAGASVNSLTVISSYRPPFWIDDDLFVEYTFALGMGTDAARLGFPDDPVAFGRALQAVLTATPGRIPSGSFARLDGEHAAIGDRFRALSRRSQADRLADLHAALPATLQARESGDAASTAASSLTVERVRRLFEMTRQSVFAVSRYPSEPYAGDITLMRPIGSYNMMPGIQADILSYWRQVTLGNVRIHDIPGDHFTCLSPEYAPGVSALLNEVAR